ncbi:MAG: hypothetical protein LQ342_007501 [Letrouitia transgressa]|nr:MAG: hypothetical protein LQ342_007501 [Letrouitia transgressa]
MAAITEVKDEPGQPPALTALSLAETAQSKSKEQIITPFDVSGGVDEEGKPKALDYDKLVDSFGARRIDKALLERFEKITGQKPHRMLRRGLVFSHRDLDQILDKYEKGIPFFLYTGRGPSSDSMHVGHTIPFEFTKYLQDVFDVPLVIMLTDDEKFLHSPKLTRKDVYKFALQNAMDIIAVGFDMKKTFIFSDIEFLRGGSAGDFQDNVLEMAKRTTINQIKGTFGFNLDNNIGEFMFPAQQSATSFATSFPFIFGTDSKKAARIPCLIPCAIDQDPYFRQCRHNAPRLKYLKPAIIHSIFLPSLRGTGSKMSASDTDSSIFLSDTDKQIQKKIGSAFSGGQDTQELQRELGGRTNVDIPFQYLTFFLEDDNELERIRDSYERGEMQSGDMKAACTRELQTYVGAFKERRKAVTEEVRKEFMRPRQLIFKGMPGKKERKEALEERRKKLQEEIARVEEELRQEE